MKIEATGTVVKHWTETTKNDKTIGHLVIFQGEGKFGPEHLALKVLGKTVQYLAGLEEGDKVTCAVDLKSKESADGSRWYTDAVAFAIKAETGVRERAEREDRREVKTRPSMPPVAPDDDSDVPF